MRNNKVYRLVIIAMLLSIMILFYFLPIGYIRVGVISITLMCLPVIVGTLVQGIGAGLLLGFLFGVTSLAQLLQAPTGLFGAIYAMKGLAPLLPIIFIPRILIPTTTFLVYKALSKAKKPLAWGVAAFVGSATNTVFVLGMTYLIFRGILDSIALELTGMAALPFLGAVVLTNGLPEAAAAVLICVPVLAALKKASPKAFSIQ